MTSNREVRGGFTDGLGFSRSSLLENAPWGGLSLLSKFLKSLKIQKGAVWFAFTCCFYCLANSKSRLLLPRHLGLSEKKTEASQKRNVQLRRRTPPAEDWLPGTPRALEAKLLEAAGKLKGQTTEERCWQEARESWINCQNAGLEAWSKGFELFVEVFAWVFVDLGCWLSKLWNSPKK